VPICPAHAPTAFLYADVQEARFQRGLDGTNPTEEAWDVLGDLRDVHPDKFESEGNVRPAGSDGLPLYNSPQQQRETRKTSSTTTFHKRTKSTGEFLRELTKDYSRMQLAGMDHSEFDDAGEYEEQESLLQSNANHPPAATADHSDHRKEGRDPSASGDRDLNEAPSSYATAASFPSSGDNSANDQQQQTTRVGPASKPNTTSSRNPSIIRATIKIRRRYKDFVDWWKNKACPYIKIAFCFVIIPATGIAAILYYLVGNPPCTNGICQAKLQSNSKAVQTVISASASWWILFLLVRQVITLSFAAATACFLVDYLALRTRVLARTAGPLVTLLVVQSRGWPVTLFFWGVYDFALLYGRYPFAKHW